VAYTQAFTDKNYNPLPRSIGVRGNRYGGNGTSPAFPGGAEIAAAVGGTLPPVMWDGITAFKTPAGETVAVADGGMHVSDAPLLNLNLKTHGTPPSAARPSIDPPTAMAQLAEPPQVRLPAAQEARVAGKLAAR
jgi:hypothetical protein